MVDSGASWRCSKFSRLAGIDPRLPALILLHENDFPTWTAYYGAAAREKAYGIAVGVGLQSGNEGHLGLANLKRWDVEGIIPALLSIEGGQQMVEAIVEAAGPVPSTTGVDLYLRSNSNEELSIALLIARMRLSRDEILAKGSGPELNGVSVSAADRIVYSRFVGSGKAKLDSLTPDQYGKHDPSGALASARGYWNQANRLLCGKSGSSCA